MGEQPSGRPGRSEPTRRRRRRRATAEQGPPPDPAAAPPAAAPSSPATPPSRSPAPAKPAVKPDKPRRRDSGTDRGMRDIVGAGRSQLGVSGALRGRDVNRPTDDDVAQAEQEVVIVRRNWKPDDR